MSINSDIFFNYKESRALSGYKSAWLVKKSGETKYHLIGATESVPYPFGDKDTFEYDLLQAPTKGSVEGKMSLDSVDVEVLHHRDNAYRYGELAKAGTLDFMSVNQELMGYKFTGTLSYKPNTAEADIHRATVTITPMSADTEPTWDASGEIEETLCFKNSIPEVVKINDTIDLAVLQANANTALSLSAKKYNATTRSWETNSSLTLSGGKTELAMSSAGLFALTVSAIGYGSWTTTVRVVEATGGAD